MAQVIWRTAGAVTRLILNRPEALNALSERMAAEFASATRRIAREPSRVVVVSGAGRAFCAGGDLSFIAANRRSPSRALAPRMRRFYGAFLSVRALPQVTIADVRGPAVGAGACLALACDLRAVGAGARLGFNFVRLGLSPGMAAWPLARAAFGDARARELLSTGRLVGGRELVRWGAASSRGAMALAREIAAGSAAALRLLTAEVRRGEDLSDFLAFEARGQARTFKGRDLAEGLAAVRQRRSPRF